MYNRFFSIIESPKLLQSKTDEKSNYRANFTIFKPFPGTPMADKLIESKQLEKNQKDWSNYTLAAAVYAPPGMTIKGLKNLRRRAFFEFYLRPKVLVKMLREIENFQHFRIIMRRIFSLDS